MKHWVCSKCAHGKPEGLGRRARHPNEPCPTCSAPGVGMVLVQKRPSATWIDWSEASEILGREITDKDEDLVSHRHSDDGLTYFLRSSVEEMAEKERQS
jgi:hypothetical protein